MESEKQFYSTSNDDSELIFYITDDQVYTYEQLWKLVRRAKQYLKLHQIKDKQRIPIYCEDPLNLIIALLAVISLGACGVLIEKGKKEAEFRAIMAQINSKVIITDNINKTSLEEVALEPVSFNSNVLTQYEEEDNLIENPDNLNQEAYIIYTSGSTGKPKGIIRTKKMIFENARVLAELYEFSKSDTVVLLVQLQHGYGIDHIFASIYGRAAHYIFDEFLYHRVLSLISENKCTAIVGVPYQFELMNRCNTNLKKNSLRLLISSGAPLRDEVNKQINAHWGVPISQVYGSSELAAALVNLNTTKFDSVGKPIEGVQVRIIDEDDKPVKQGDIGELVIKSPFCTSSYVASGELKLPKRHQWFYTGDYAYIDKQGDVFITGRKLNMINVSGKKVSPEEVEKVIINYQGVKEVKVSGEVHPIAGEIAVATIVTENGCRLDEIGLLTFCKKFLTDYKIPRNIYYADKLERTTNGKLQRSR